MRRAIIFAGVAACLFVIPASAQQAASQSAQAGTYTFKDPGTATVISVLVPGGGQLYTGDTGRGLALLGIGVGGLVVGSYMTFHTAASSVNCTTFGCLDSSTNRAYAWFGLGVAAYLGTWIYGIIDAAPSARRMNTKHGFATSLLGIEVHPIAAPSQKGMNLGARLTF